MLVREVIDAIESKQLTINQLAEQYQVTKRTVQNKIKSLGFVWDSKKVKYNHDAVPEDAYSLVFDDLFQNKVKPKEKQTKSNTEHSREFQKHSAQKEIASAKEYDTLDYLLFGEQIKADKRTYRGFYLDNDILAIIDNVKAGNKSDLVNEALRYVFKQKGLL